MSKTAYLISIVILCAISAFHLYFSWQDNQYKLPATQIIGRINSDIENQDFSQNFTVKGLCVKNQQQAKINVGDLISVSGSLEEKVTESGVKEYCLIAETIEVIEPFNQVPFIKKILLYQFYFLKSQLSLFRQLCVQKISYNFKANQASILAGMILGYKQGLSYSLWQDFQQSGLLHLVVASGGNIALLSGVVITIVRPIFSRKKQILFSYGVIITYLFLAGFDPPLIRASLMIGLVWLGQLLGRKTASWWILLLTCLFMLLYKPLLLFSASFQLSFAATAGIVLFGKKIQGFLLQLLGSLKQSPITKIILADGSQSIAAQILVTPLILQIFGQTNALSLLANLLVAPLVAPIMIIGLVFLVLSFTIPFLGQLVAWLLMPLLDFVVLVAQFFSKSSWGMISFGLPWIGVFAIWLMTILLLKPYED
ncbi:ComEC/Rec2 family competence protein [Candidatus Beckwithbacteria bacterium]|nr:ComEC/Rec2 family competence protein [Candidatus Beckwithbacteria bacterium]